MMPTSWMVLALLVAALAVAPRGSRAALRLVGRYKLKLNQFQACEDEGTRTLRFEMSSRQLPSGEKAFTGNVTFPQDFGTGVSGRVAIAQYGSGGWTPNAFTHISQNMCKDIKNMAPGYFNSLAKALDVPAQCPMPKGQYQVVDWEVGLSVPYPVLPYGMYRVDVVYNNATARLGCVRWILHVLKRT